MRAAWHRRQQRHIKASARPLRGRPVGTRSCGCGVSVFRACWGPCHRGAALMMPACRPRHGRAHGTPAGSLRRSQRRLGDREPRLPGEDTCQRRRQNEDFFHHITAKSPVHLQKWTQKDDRATGDRGLRPGPKAAGMGPAGHRTILRINSLHGRAARGLGVATQDAGPAPAPARDTPR